MLLSAMGAGKGGERKKGRESARKPGKTNAVRRKRGESHDFSAIALADTPCGGMYDFRVSYNGQKGLGGILEKSG